jgi:hypothetical protein
MTENPYQSPATDARVVGINSGNIEDLRKVAKYQKAILTCILIQLLAIGLQFALSAELRILLSLGLIIVGVASTVFIFLLATHVYSTGLGVLLGILALIPCIGLIVLLAINGKATTVLRNNGIEVGLLGANLSKI